MSHRSLTALLLAAAVFTMGAAMAGWPFSDQPAAGDETLVGAWRGKVQFSSGPFAAVKDLEFMYAFNQGGTMTESSNYDGAPPVPPAYGVWRKVKPWQYEAKYSFFLTKPNDGVWTPAGHGVLTEQITLSQDGKSFRSTIQMDLFDETGKLTDSSSKAEVQAKRIAF
jgi:hypothetical protein